MKHQHGIELYIKHGDETYEELPVPIDESQWSSLYPENTRLQGEFNTQISQVAIRKNLDPGQDESMTLSLGFTKKFSFFSANAVRVRICVGEQNEVLTYDSVLTKAEILAYRAAGYFTMPNPKYLPAARKDDAVSTKKWKTKHSADRGSVTVFVTRGHQLGE